VTVSTTVHIIRKAATARMSAVLALISRLLFMAGRSTCSLETEFLPNRSGRVTDFINGLLQLIPPHSERVGPILYLVIFVHVDFGAVRLDPIREIV
jgi:hypothetical protein